MIELYSMIIAIQLIASGTHIVAKSAMTQMRPEDLLFFRSITASTVFLLLLSFRNRSLAILRNIEKRDLLKLLALGFASIPLNQFFFLYGLHYSLPANSALLFSTTPMFTLVLSAIFFAERISLKKVIGIVIAFIGVLPIIFEHGISLSSDFTYGNILLLISVLAWAAYTVFGKELVLRYGAVRVTGISMIFGTLEYLIIFSFLPHPALASNYSAFAWGGMLYLALLASVLAYIMWYKVLAKIDISKATVFQNLQPVLTTAFAFLFLGIPTTPLFIICGAVTMAGVVLTQRG